MSVQASDSDYLFFLLLSLITFIEINTMVEVELIAKSSRYHSVMKARLA